MDYVPPLVPIISRSRKIRCDSTRPVCNNCARRSNECEYDWFQNEEVQISVLVRVNDLVKSDLQTGQPHLVQNASELPLIK